MEIIKNAKNQYNLHQVEKSLLRDEYEQDRENIIKEIKDAINRKDIEYANSIIDKYSSVAEDETFRVLSKEVYSRKAETSSLEALITKFEITDTSKQQERYKICKSILELDPSNEKFKSELIKCEYALGLRKEVDSDLRLGRIKDDSFEGILNYQNSNFPFMNEKVIVRVHTHGISIKHKKDIYRIHHSQISNLSKDTDIKESIVAAVALGAIGYALGGIGDAIDGASAGLGSITAYLKIQYWNIDTSKSDIMLIGFSNEKDVSKIINRYNKEVEITKRTHRPPKSEINYIKKALIAIGIIILVFFILPSLCSSPAKDASPKQEALTTENQSVSTPEDSLELPVTDKFINSNEWVALTSKQCSIKGTDESILTVHGQDITDAAIELSKTGISKCNKLSIKIDRKQPTSLNCSNHGNTITIDADGIIIKDMRKSSSIEISIPNGSKQKKFKFSLTGFSKACEWTK